MNLDKIIEHSKNLNVLYVEDCDINRNSTLGILEDFFNDVIIAVDGEDGLEKFKKNQDDHIGVVITDINMPKLNGLDMIKEIRAIDDDIPILVFSAHTEIEYFLQSIKLGIDGYLPKPIEIEQFIGIISKIVKSNQNKIEIKKNQELLHKYEKMEALTSMLNNIAHHWRQPLSTISTIAGAIELSNEYDTATPNSNITHAVDIINATQSLSKMIEDFTKLHDDSSLHTSHKINLKNLFNEIITTINSDDIEFITEIKDIDLMANQALMIDIFLPICKNAVEAVIKNNDQNKKLIFIDASIKSNQITIEIKDNGTGIASHILHKIFDPYFTTKHQSYGTGLNLYFVNHIVSHYLNGTISASNKSYTYENRSYTGALFTIVFNKNTII